MLLEVDGVVKDFADVRVLDGVDLRIDRREKVALVGRNGTGKTTLLRILTGAYEPDGGSVRLARGAKIGFLRQEDAVESGRTVLDVAEDARKEAVRLKEQIEELEKRLEEHSTPEDLELYATLHEHYEELEGYSAERDLTAVLGRVGFAPADFDKSTDSLSGGEKTRLALARLLLEQPDLLILDEPTNHLDLQATEWLEGWIRGYTGAVLLVSHDKEFLRNTAERVVVMEDCQTKSYPGGFDKFLKLREEERERLERVAKKQKAEMDKLDEYVRRFMGSERTAQARGRLKMLQRMEASAVVVPKDAKKAGIGFEAGERSGDIVLECRKLEMGFGERTLFRDLDWTVRSGERWGVIGENGAGKSTLVKIAVKELVPRSGTVRIGSNVTLGYFAQDHIDLDSEQTPFKYLVYDYGLDPGPARTLLGRFLFGADDIFRPIGTLSGGEKNKLVLAGLTTLKPNLLVLDEPTNHLDMDSRDVLGQVLSEYKGTLILISHDRSLLSKATDHTFDLKRTGATVYPGSYLEYRRSLASPRPVVTAAKVEERPALGLSPREVSKAIARLEREIEGVEIEISEEEDAIKGLEKLLEAPDPAQAARLSEEHTARVEALHGLMALWEAKSLELEELRAPAVVFRSRKEPSERP